MEVSRDSRCSCDCSSGWAGSGTWTRTKGEIDRWPSIFIWVMIDLFLRYMSVL